MNLTKNPLIPTGPQVSPIILGFMNLSAWEMSTKDLRQMLEKAIDMGLTTFDHADIYGGYTCEAIFGAALAEDPTLRSKMQLISKCGIKLISPNRPQHAVKHYDTSQAHIIASVDNSLKQLHTDYLDLLLIHRPDPFMDVDDTAAGLTAVKKAGKVRHIGVSNFLPHQVNLLASRLDFPLVTNQVEFSVMHLTPLHDGTFDQCQEKKITPTVWSPLAGGRIFREEGEQATRLRQTMTDIAHEVGGAGLDQIALAWILNHPAKPIPVLGTGKFERIKAAVDATQITLTRQQWFRIWQASTGHEVP